MKPHERQEVLKEDFLENMTDEQVREHFNDGEGFLSFKNKKEYN